MSLMRIARDDLALAIKQLPEVTGKTVVRSWVPIIERDEVSSYGDIHVAPAARRTRITGRSCLITSVDVHVGIIYPLDRFGRDEDKGEEGQALVDAIIAALLGKRIGGEGNLICTAAEQLIATSPTHWREQQLFATFLSVTLET